MTNFRVMLCEERRKETVEIVIFLTSRNSDTKITQHIRIRTQYQPPFLLEAQLPVPNFEKEMGGESERNKCLGGLKEFLLEIFARRELNMFLA